MKIYYILIECENLREELLEDEIQVFQKISNFLGARYSFLEIQKADPVIF